ncbi:hypothetical protein RJ639_035677 [Escallonia herrerae]|uniref:Morc S5 domain-containing protein n=1 Tax=Escallonia herrerae TaxID=1293975 RepID=A0AA88WS09_9ASTE|nr:hypothetical protein RJ639_035677 [Escallonia herrerae]
MGPSTNSELASERWLARTLERDEMLAAAASMMGPTPKLSPARFVDLCSDDEIGDSSGKDVQKRSRSVLETPESKWSSEVKNPCQENGRNHLRIHPMFLHSNATSHKWAFGAIGELLDNAVDEIQNGATFAVIDKTTDPQDRKPALLIQDDGGGMDPEAIRCCLSFEFSDKNKKCAIGQYGNGFKTSSMRLGADVIVFSRHSRKRALTQSVGLLSYTFLRQTGQDRIVVSYTSQESSCHDENFSCYEVVTASANYGLRISEPFPSLLQVDYERNAPNGKLEPILPYGEEHFSSNLSVLLQWSPYSTEEMLLKQFDDIGNQGTKNVIYNLWLNNDGSTELDFDFDAEDIRINYNAELFQTDNRLKPDRDQHIANLYRFSLRVCSILLQWCLIEFLSSSVSICIHLVPTVTRKLQNSFARTHTQAS